MNNGNESEKSPQPSNRRLFAVARMVLLFLLVIALLYWLFGWMKESILYVHETDARVMADLITISSEVEGKIVKRFVSEGTNVRKGDPLIQINSRLIDLKIKQIKAEYQTNSAELSKTSAEYNMIAEQLKARIGSENAKLLEAHANKRVIAHDVALLDKEF
ncbi:MAG: biotin/lipoyl-binding protein, partial [Pseudomonadota bacterium]|nr:biotin/lipoyl-binding protein [Pseudomonadota bacterium]